jgi:hypothetical protein
LRKLSLEIEEEEKLLPEKEHELELDSPLEIWLNPIDFITIQKEVIINETIKDRIRNLYPLLDAPKPAEPKDLEAKPEIPIDGEKAFNFAADLDAVIAEVSVKVAGPYMNFGGVNIGGVFCTYYWLLIHYKKLEVRKSVSASKILNLIMDQLQVPCK